MSHYFLSLRSTFCFIGLIHIVMCHNTSEEFVPVCIFNAFYGAQCTKRRYELRDPCPVKPEQIVQCLSELAYFSRHCWRKR